VTRTPPIPAPLPNSGFEIGEPVEVRDRFQGWWSRGFEIAGQSSGGYAVRRLSDRSVLPAPFSVRELRSADVGR
jgi:hypothetical protein